MKPEIFLQKMQEVVEELRRDPEIQVITWHVFPPATEAEIAEAEETIGKKLPDDLREFYRCCNGVQLRWKHASNNMIDHRVWNAFIPGPFDTEEIYIEPYLDGVINILPVKTVFLTKWAELFKPNFLYLEETPLEIDGKEYDRIDFLNICYIFDLHDSMSDISLFIDQGKTHFLVRYEFHSAPSPDSYSVLDLNTFLHLTTITKGDIGKFRKTLWKRHQKKRLGKAYDRIDDTLLLTQLIEVIE